MYYFIFFIIFFSHLSSRFFGVAEKKITVLFLALLLILFAGLRAAGVGADDYNYIHVFENIYDYVNLSGGSSFYSISDLNMEYGFLILNYLVHFFSSSYTILFIVVAFFSIGLNIYNINKYSNYVFVSVALYFAHFYLLKDMNQIRIGLSSAFLLFLIDSIYYKRKFRSAAIILISLSFHLSSVISVFIPIVYYLRSRRLYFFVLIASIFLGWLGGGFYFVINYLPDLGDVTTKLSYYLNDSRYNQSINFFDLVNVKNILLISLLLVYYNELKLKYKFFEVIFVFFYVGVVFRLAFIDFSIVSARVSAAITMVDIILIPYLISCFRYKSLLVFIVFIYAFIQLYLNINRMAFGSGVYSSVIF